MKKIITTLAFLLLVLPLTFATNWYFHPTAGNNENRGTSPEAPFRSLKKLTELSIDAGDTVFLFNGTIFSEPLILDGWKGQKGQEIVVRAYGNDESSELQNALVENSSGVKIENITVKANGYKPTQPQQGNMRCGVLVTATQTGAYQNITLSGLHVHDIFYENMGFQRGADEVVTANGTQNYGWGIRFINNTTDAVLSDIVVENTSVQNVAHTGIKFTSRRGGIRNVKVTGCEIANTGGPGIQMSGLVNGHFHHNKVNRSGSFDDSRKWGRGSGLWTWDSDSVIIEHNEFRNANGFSLQQHCCAVQY